MLHAQMWRAVVAVLQAAGGRLLPLVQRKCGASVAGPMCMRRHDYRRGKQGPQWGSSAGGHRRSRTAKQSTREVEKRALKGSRFAL